MSKLATRAASLALFCSVGFAMQDTEAAVPLAWTASSLSRIWRDSPAGAATRIDMWAARDETYSFQIGVQGPPGGLTGVDITTLGLTGPDSAAIAGNDIALFREQYVYVPSAPPYYWRGTGDGTNPPGPPGWYPDGLIPFVDPETGQPARRGVLTAAPFDVAPGENQAIWVDVHVPPGSPSGSYTGRFTISSEQGHSSVQLTLHVWGFTLPKAPSFKSSYQADASHHDIYLSHELLRNRVSPDWDNGPAERTLIDDWGLTSTNASYFGGVGIDNCKTKPMSPAPSVAQFRAVSARHQPDIPLYNFSADEISACSNQYPALKEWARNMQAAGIQNMVTVMPTQALEDDGTGTGRSAVDIWVELPAQYDRAIQEVTKVRAKGDSVWSYNVLVQDGYSPKHEISFTPLDYRLNMGFISQSLGLAGFQQWKVDQWTSDPWNSLPVYGGVYSDGLLVYPGRQAGLTGYAPSMRLKWTRDGVDDFEYVEILKKLGDSEWALWQARSVGPDWRNWTRDTTQVEAVRLALGNRIEWLVSGQASNIPVVNSQGAVQATAGTALSYQVAASNNPVSFDAVGLPAGIAIDRSSGLISGTPAFAGNTQVLIRATNAAGSGSAILDLKVDPPASPIALVQSNSVEGSAVQSVSAAFQTGNTGGNLVIAFVRMSTTTQTVTVSDTAGNSYSEAIAQAQDADGHQVHIFYARKIARGPNRVTAAFSSANNHPWLAIYEYRGLNTTDPLDQTAAAQGSGATPATGAAALAATAGELVFTGTGLPASFTGSVVNTGYYTLTQQDTGSARAANAGALAFSIAPYTGKFTLNTSADWTAVLATFKP